MTEISDTTPLKSSLLCFVTKKVKTGKYTTTDGKYEIEKSDGFWYAVDAETGQSVVDCENSLSAIKDSLESYIKSHGKKESFRIKRGRCIP